MVALLSNYKLLAHPETCRRYKAPLLPFLLLRRREEVADTVVVAIANYCAGCLARHQSNEMTDSRHTLDGKGAMNEDQDHERPACSTELVDSHRVGYVPLQNVE